jgi:coenzyme F420-0:L-glutamate ligase/coenzyme F420-1:gamma-L-glutamate ligase
MSRSMRLTALAGIPLIEPGDTLDAIIAQALARGGERLGHGDVVVVAQKIVSKAEGRYVRLREVSPSPQARLLAREIGRPPEYVEVILSQSKRVLRKKPGLLVVEHHNGWVHANAGVDQSNIESDVDDPRVLLLPRDPDRSAAELRLKLSERCGADVRVIINDSAGRAWRNGVCGFAVGCAGFAALLDRRGQPDLFGRLLETTQVAVADELAAAASFLMGQAAERSPVVLIRGAELPAGEGGAAALIRPESEDLFR